MDGVTMDDPALRSRIRKAQAETLALAIKRAIMVGTDANTPRRGAQKEDASDAYGRRFTRKRAHDAVARLLRDKAIEQREWLAVETFRDCHALAEGVIEGGAIIMGGGRAHWQCTGLSDVVLDAYTARTAAIRAVGLRRSAVFVASALGDIPMRAIERDLNMRNGTGNDVLIEALRVLAQHYLTDPWENPLTRDR